MATWNRVTTHGILYAQEEFAIQWNFGLGSSAIADFAALTTAATAIKTFVESIDGAASTNELNKALGASASISSIHVDCVVDGVTANSGEADVAYIASSATSTLPPQNALVTSLLTDFNTRSTRGRTYWPMLNANNMGAGKLTLSETLWITSFRAYLNGYAQALATTAGADLEIFTPSVYSKKLNELTEITRLRVNNIIDTQRRRSWSLIPTSTTVPYVVGT